MQPVNKNETINSLLKENNEHLLNLCHLKEDQQLNDNLWREKWLDEKRASSRMTKIQILVGVLAFSISVMAFAIGVVEVDQTNELVVAVKLFASSVAGVF